MTMKRNLAALVLAVGVTVGPSLAIAPPAAYASGSAHNIYRGQTGKAVSCVQELLNSRGGYDLVIDGVYGKRTYAALTDYQGDHGLTADGIVGPATGTSLHPPTSSTCYRYIPTWY